MSRSKKLPFGGWTTARSEKNDKRHWHKRARAVQRQRIHHCDDPLPVLDDEVSNPCVMSKDGKTYYGEDEKWTRK